MKKSDLHACPIVHFYWEKFQKICYNTVIQSLASFEREFLRLKIKVLKQICTGCTLLFILYCFIVTIKYGGIQFLILPSWRKYSPSKVQNTAIMHFHLFNLVNTWSEETGEEWYNFFFKKSGLPGFLIFHMGGQHKFFILGLLYQLLIIPQCHLRQNSANYGNCLYFNFMHELSQQVHQMHRKTCIPSATMLHCDYMVTKLWLYGDWTVMV